MNIKKKEFIIINIIYINLFFLYFTSFVKNKLRKYNSKFIKLIENEYKNFEKVNINNIEYKIYDNKPEFNNFISTINVGFTLDKNYTLETMLTSASIMETQKRETKIIFHFGVTKNFSVDNMLEMYSLKEKINNSTEFNFYYLKDSVKKMKNFHKKGEACPGKFELPSLLPNEVERLIIFDAGDVLVLRDLTDLYNYDMGEYWALGNPEPLIIDSFMKVKYNISKYINIGAVLLNVKKLKEINFWENYYKHRYLKLKGAPDQTLFNILIPDNKKNYLPFRFGSFSIIRNDHNFDKMKFEEFKFKNWFKSNLSLSLPENPKTEEGILINLYNPRFIHQFNGKWEKGDGLSIYRILAKYFIKISGIQERICIKKPGYCK